MESQADIAIRQKQEAAAEKNSKAGAFMELMKLRLSSLVVFSAIITYFTVAKNPEWLPAVMLFLGGFLITGASNGFNQIWETELDKLMLRTCGRPLPTQRLGKIESLVFCSITGLAGTALLWLFNNPLSAIIGFISLLLYAIVYTPLKIKTPWAVFIGAFPGALPPMIGAVAATEGFGKLEFIAWVLFLIQFMWQFPHFWAIAWVSHDDYQRAGFFMLPSLSGRSKNSAFQILVYTLFLVPISILPSVFGFTSWICGGLILIFGVLFFLQSVKLYNECSVAAARKLMFGSFIYLPVVQILILVGKWIPL